MRSPQPARSTPSAAPVVPHLPGWLRLLLAPELVLVASLGQGRVNAIAFSPDGTLLVTGEGREAGTVSIWRVADGTLLRTLDPALTPSIQSIDISPDGQQLAVGMDEQVQLFAMADGALVHTFDISGISVAYAPDGARIVIADNLPSIEIWDVATKTISIRCLDMASAWRIRRMEHCLPRRDGIIRA